jgi:exopolyphosphatase/guanosine-5'-triphosphate,3'-diphosphate pyrophosphatase
VAAIDVGANSTHLLVARVGESVEALADESVLLGLGAAVYASEIVPADVADAVIGALLTYVERARSLGAAEPVLMGTEPFRLAGNAARVVARICREVGVPFHVLRHDEEGLLTLLGATGGAALDAEIVIVDIGGGSSEIVVAGPGRRPVMRGLQLGSARASAHHVEHDPPTPVELDAIRAEAARVLEGAPDARPARIILVGGTASNLLKVGAAAPTDDVLTRERLARALAELLLEPAVAVAEQHAIRVQRARILGAGAAIVEAILDRYGLDAAVATDEGIRQGAAIASARAGAAWRDALPHLVGVG